MSLLVKQISRKYRFFPIFSNKFRNLVKRPLYVILITEILFQINILFLQIVYIFKHQRINTFYHNIFIKC